MDSAESGLESSRPAFAGDSLLPSQYGPGELERIRALLASDYAGSEQHRRLLSHHHPGYGGYGATAGYAGLARAQASLLRHGYRRPRPLAQSSPTTQAAAAAAVYEFDAPSPERPASPPLGHWGD